MSDDEYKYRLTDYLPTSTQGVSLYFRHKVRSPNNVLLAWHYMPVVPRIGDKMSGPFGDWKITNIVWRSAADDDCPFACIDVHVEDAS